MINTTIIVVCGTYYEWLHFQRCVHFSSNLVYMPLINNEYNKLMGLDKYTTEVMYIGTWYKDIKKETKKFLELFRW